MIILKPRESREPAKITSVDFMAVVLYPFREVSLDDGEYARAVAAQALAVRVREASGIAFREAEAG